ncbi:RNA polymerase sigma-70 factor, ECF subfamily [Mariniphaga anaerophila]|uniref:RNA polymerase sigma-70 factor, ECF subfamily n=1 Tax=Mariniphaga anaerophila TaxID=1484053 RepID=A0A1M5EMX7_9BACT|nr:RNA polymerase sigma-70 factor [Mariniphaga anaerophila]SHF80557.1 RNA polymerase sigma-70 factor, ECF subfamily [Mariniphaga anaerophila]
MLKKNSDTISPEFLLFKAGNEKVFDKIFRINYNKVTGFCNQFIFDLDKSKSITQEAFLKLWLNRDKVQTENGIYSFLYTAAKTECLNYLRHKKIEKKYLQKSIEEKEYLLTHDIIKSFNFDEIHFTELEKAIQKAIEELPDRCREVFLKSRSEGKKNREIAEELGIAVKSVETNMTRALKILRKRLAEFLTVLIVLILGF